LGTLALRVSGGTKRYHRRGQDSVIFQDVDFTLEEGRVLALLGPSGCGKSTLLRTIAGLESLSGGTIEIETSAEGDPTVGIVFQDALLLPWLTVAENVGLGLTFGANKHARTLESVDQLLSDFGLSPIAHSYPNELSGGQAQRASLARTIVTRPQLLLLDEPFAALDPRTRASLQDWLLEISDKRHLTVVIVTHDIDEALHLGDHVVLMSPRPGRILKTWDLERSDLRIRGRHGDAVRTEILRLYETDVTVSTPAANWSI
jgi:ABC-type nitrate/sulfonate/bicarbonate transport system ATPase subunit